MASRPLPPGRRGRGSRTVSAVHLPDVKLLSVTAPDVPSTESDVPDKQQPKDTAADPEVEPTNASEPEHGWRTTRWEPTVQQQEQPAPFREHVKSVRDVIASLEGSAKFAAGNPSPPVAVEVPIAEPVAFKSPIESTLQPEEPSNTMAMPEPVQTVVVVKQESPAPVCQPTASIAVQTSAPMLSVLSASSTAAAADTTGDGFHPFQLLTPVYSVPHVPATVECVYDDAAVEMQKNVMKVVKKLLNRDRIRLEDFKINSRLYGNNFIDPHEYMEYLANDFGAVRALQLVPCLISIQPDYMKRNSLLTAARNFRLRNLAKLENECDRLGTVQCSDTGSATDAVLSAERAPAPELPINYPETTAITNTDVPSIFPEQIERSQPHPSFDEQKIHDGHEPLVSAAPITVVGPSLLVAEPDNNRPQAVPPQHICQVTTPQAYGQVSIALHEYEAAMGDNVEESDLARDVPLATQCGVVEEVHELEPIAADSATSLFPTMATVDEVGSVGRDTGSSPATVVTETQGGLVSAPAVHTVAGESRPGTGAEIEAPIPVSLHEANTMAVTVVTSEIASHEDVSDLERRALESTPRSAPDQDTVGEANLPTKLFDDPVEVETSVQPVLSTPSSAIARDTAVELYAPTNLFGEPVEAETSVQPVLLKKQSSINLFGEDLGSDDDDDDRAEAPSSTFFEAETLFGEPLTHATTVAAHESAKVSHRTTPALTVKPPHASMLFGLASAGADSDESDSDSEFSD